MRGEFKMERLLDILKDLHEDIDYINCIDLVDGGILDSFDIVTLIADISEEFDINIPAEEIVPENFNSVEAIDTLIKRLIDEN